MATAGGREMPLVPGLPFLGSALDVLDDPARALIDAYRTYGPAFRIKVLRNEVVVLAGSEAQQFFTTEGERHFTRSSFFSTFSGELGVSDIILGASGTRHAQLRSALKLGFCREAVAPHVPAMAAATREAIRAVTPDTDVALVSLLGRIGYEQFGVLLAGRRVDEGFADVDLYVQTIMEVASKLWPPALLLRPDYQFAKRRSFALMRKLHRERLAQPAADDRPMTVLDALIAGNARKGGALSEDDVIGHALFGYVGSVFYMKRAIGFLLYEILNDPALHARVRAECDGVHASDGLTAEALRHMPILRGAFTESLRRYPIQLALPFVAEHDFEFQGFTIKAGTTCYVSSIANHLSERYYGCPYAFQADRCMEPRNEHRPRGAYAPFGMGSRVCAAAGLVEAMALVTVSTMLHEVDMELVAAPKRFRAVLNPLPGPSSGLKVRVKGLRRHDATAPVPIALDRVSDALPLIDPSQLQALLGDLTARQFAPGEAIIRQGDDADNFYIALEGSAEVFKARPDGEPQKVGTLGAGDYFGEIGLLTGSRRTATVRAGAPGLRALVLDRETFLNVVAESDLMSGEVARLVRRRFMVNALLQALPSLDESGAAELVPEIELVRFTSGAVIVRQGEPAEAFYIVAAGQVDVIREAPDGVRVPLARLAAGEFFGELGLLHAIPRTATVESASDETEVVVVSRASFQRLVRSTPLALTDIVSTVCQRLAGSLAG